ncbi:MAG: bifunctional phosphoribosyl-AMP cyclohydrolase/phosphoribosyl-ATP diphosphatase HisIE [Lachnospiraceae bacterium]|nr:bifunctional phosphoribosyl-AMP cyclohydrolase/phosphoribosyl-ATP diphosphatase HisIE [Lachnospiraceae bacterium]
MEHKNLIATIYLKNGMAVKGKENLECAGELKKLAKIYNDSGVDKLYVFDLSETEKEHDTNLHTIKELSRIVEIPLYGIGGITHLEDVKKLIYAGCKGVILDGAHHDIIQVAEEAAKRFGREKLLVSMENVDLIFKHKKELQEYVHKLVVLNEAIIESLENIIDIPFSVIVEGYNKERWVEVLKKDCVTGIGGSYISDPATYITELKQELAAEGIETKKFESAMEWSEFKLNSDGMIPVIVQDYKTAEVLMMAYMNEEAFHTTLSLGKMTYYSRSRKELWIKGETSGHYQYVKSLTIDCDKDTLLAKVSQVGAACHTGNTTCFFQELVKKEFVTKNPLKVFESVYEVIQDRKENPKEGSYTNYLFDKGIDKILKKMGEEATEIVIASKNPEKEEIKYEISDFLYHMMVLMVEKGVTWEDIVEELSQR